MRKLALALSVALAGCTSVGTIRSEDAKPLSANQAMIGVSYALPAIQYTITTSRLLDKCDTASPQFAVKPEVTATYVAGERFEVDPTKLSSILKTTSLGLTTQDDNDTLKSFNAAADDKTGDVLVDAAKIGVSIASFAASGGTVPGVVLGGVALTESADPAQKRLGFLMSGKEELRYAIKIECSALAVTRLADYKAKVKALKSAELELTSLNDQIALQKTLFIFESFAQANVPALTKLVTDSIAKSAEVADKRKAVSDAKALLEIVSTEQWPKASWRNNTGSNPMAELAISDPARKYEDFCENFEVKISAMSETDKTLTSMKAISPPGKCDGLLLALADQSKVRVRIEPVVARAASDDGVDLAFEIDPEKRVPASSFASRSWRSL